MGRRHPLEGQALIPGQNLVGELRRYSRSYCAGCTVTPFAPGQFCRGLLWLVVRVWTSATGRLMVLVVVMAGRVPLLPSVAV